MENLIQKYLSDNGLSGVNGVDYSIHSYKGIYTIKDWNFNIAIPTFTNEEIEQQNILDIFNYSKNQLIDARKKYLNNTDWYVIRYLDNSVICPSEIQDMRQLARTEIDAIENADEATINNFNLNFGE